MPRQKILWDEAHFALHRILEDEAARLDVFTREITATFIRVALQVKAEESACLKLPAHVKLEVFPARPLLRPTGRTVTGTESNIQYPIPQGHPPIQELHPQPPPAPHRMRFMHRIMSRRNIFCDEAHSDRARILEDEAASPDVITREITITFIRITLQMKPNESACPNLLTHVKLKEVTTSSLFQPTGRTATGTERNIQYPVP
jgi:hypothetical protein